MFNNTDNYTDERRVWMLDVLYFFINDYNYSPIQVTNESGDLWLLNRSAEKYPIIRLTLDRTNKSTLEREAIMQQAEFIGNLINLNARVLSIHFGPEDQPLIQESEFSQAIMNDDFVSAELTSEFKDIDKAIKFVSDPIHDLKERQIKLNQMRPQAPKRRGLFNFKNMTGANIIGLICMVIYIITNILSFRYGKSQALIMSGAVYKTFIYSANEWWRLLTAGFVHADFFHLLMNMIVLMQTGLLVERVFSRKRFFVIFIVSVITSSLFALIMGGANKITMGASGGIYGLFGAVLVYLISSKLILVPLIRRQVFSVLMANLFLSLLPGISFYGHLGGLIGGGLVSLVFVESSRFQDIKKHAVSALVILVIGLVSIGFFKDNKIYDVNKSLDHAVVSSVRDLGLEQYGDYLMRKLNIYYGRIGV